MYKSRVDYQHNIAYERGLTVLLSEVNGSYISSYYPEDYAFEDCAPADDEYPFDEEYFPDTNYTAFWDERYSRDYAHYDYRDESFF